jgi:hypothetical protein
MSNSRKKTSIGGIIHSPSEKEDKRLYNRSYRRVCKQILESNIEVELLPHLREHSNPYSMNKDGKHWFDAKKYPERMRK